MASYTRNRLPVAPTLAHTLPSHDRAVSPASVGMLPDRNRAHRLITASPAGCGVLSCIRKQSCRQNAVFCRRSCLSIRTKSARSWVRAKRPDSQLVIILSCSLRSPSANTASRRPRRSSHSIQSGESAALVKNCVSSGVLRAWSMTPADSSSMVGGGALAMFVISRCQSKMLRRV